MDLTGGDLANQTLAALPAAFFQHLRRDKPVYYMGYSDNSVMLNACLAHDMILPVNFFPLALVLDTVSRANFESFLQNKIENHLEAFALLGNIFADEKNYNLAYTNYGHFFEGKKRENAKVDMRKIDEAKLKFNFGKCCIKLGKFDVAEQNLKGSEYLKISDNVIEVAKLYEEAEQLKLAIQYYKSALHL